MGLCFLAGWIEIWLHPVLGDDNRNHLGTWERLRRSSDSSMLPFLLLMAFLWNCHQLCTYIIKVRLFLQEHFNVLTSLFLSRSQQEPNSWLWLRALSLESCANQVVWRKNRKLNASLEEQYSGHYDYWKNALKLKTDIKLTWSNFMHPSKQIKSFE